MRLTRFALAAGLALGCTLQTGTPTEDKTKAEAAPVTPGKPGTPPAGTPPAGTPPTGALTPPTGTPPTGTPPAGTPPAIVGTPGVRYTGPSITAGSMVKIMEIHKDDLYFPDQAKLKDQSCMVTDSGGGLVNAGDGFFSGGAMCAGTSYYFYKVGVELVGTMVPEKPSPKVAGTPATVAEITPDSTVKLLEIHKEDAYYPDASTIVGLTCTVTKEGMHDNGGSFYGGGANCGPAKTYYYFYKAQIELISLAAAKPAPTVVGTRFTGSDVAPGKKIRLLEIHKDDAYFPDADTIIGQSCTVTTEGMHNNGGDFFGGGCECGPGKTYYYFYKAAIEVTP